MVEFTGCEPIQNKESTHHSQLTTHNQKPTTMSLTSISIKRPTLIVVIFTVLGLLGIVSYFSIGYELLPKMSKQIITISTAYPGAAPSEVENSVTKKVEDAVSSLEKLDNIKSQSFEGNIESDR